MKIDSMETPGWRPPPACPFFVSASQDCKAGRAGPVTRQFCYCETEDYEDCPLFLSRLLRNSRPKFRGVLDLALK